MRALIPSLGLIALAACAGGAPFSPRGVSLTGPAAKNRSPQSGKVFISNTNYNDMAYFSLSGSHKLLGTIAGAPLAYPTGMAADARGNLYVANAGGFVLVYPPDLKNPNELEDPGYFPNDVAVGSDGTIYAANLFKLLKASKEGPGNVVAYAPGASKPTKTFNDRHFFYVTGVAVDAKDDVFVSYDEGTDRDPTKTGRVAEYVDGSSKPKEIIAVPGPKDNSGVTAITLDAQGDIVIAAYGTATFDVYPPGRSKPSRTFSSGKNGISEGIAFDRSGRYLYSTELASKLADIFRYSNGKEVGTIEDNSTSQYGIAITPPL
ncbi:MAG TPA: hypothetical protein VGI19_06880 [Candidatus Cybelea sp.]|jgi:sugar lactone lactonase YvrE